MGVAGWGADAAAGVGVAAGGAPHGDRDRGVTGDQVDQGRVDTGRRVDAVVRVVVVPRPVLAQVVSAPRRAGSALTPSNRRLCALANARRSHSHSQPLTTIYTCR